MSHFAQSDARHRMHARTPARRWKDGFPCGNGRLGAVLCGGVQTERMLVNEETWYFRAHRQELPDLSDCLPIVREALREGRIDEANGLYERVMRERGYAPSIGIFMPGLDLVVKSLEVHPFSGYRRWLEMASGSTGVEWSEGGARYSRRMLVSRVHDVIAVECAAEEGGALNLTIGLELHDLHDAIDQAGKRFDPDLERTAEVRGSHLVLRVRDRRAGNDFHAVARVIVSGAGAVEDVDARNGCRFVRGAERVLVLLDALPAGATRGDVERAVERLDSLPSDYETLSEAHGAKHRELFLRARFSLDATDRERSNELLLLEAYDGKTPASLIERMWDYGRYLLLGSSSAGGLPSHLQGVWNGDYDPPWQCFNMANENIQMNYWQALAGNLPEVMDPFFSYYEGLIEDFRLAAKRLYGCRGIYVPAATAPGNGLPTVLHAHLTYWISGAGWLASHFFDYYLFTGDVGFLRERALPFMREAALFYEDYLVPSEDGKLCFVPSISPENCPPERERSWSQGGPLFISENATMDVAICRELLTHLIEAAGAEGLYVSELPRWREMLENLPVYEVNADGAIREWLHQGYRDNYRHRHLSHLYPVFPGNEVSRERDPELFAAFARAVEMRLVVGLDEQTGWSLAHMANIHARMGDGERAGECLELLARSCVGPNLFTYHNDYRRSGITMDMLWGETAPFQIDANMGWTAAVQEMVLYSRPGFLRLLPAVPSSWRRGAIEGWRARGQVTLDLAWDLDTGLAQGRLRADRAMTLRIEAPGRLVGGQCRFDGAEGARVFDDGISIELKLRAGDWVSFDMSFELAGTDEAVRSGCDGVSGRTGAVAVASPVEDGER